MVYIIFYYTTKSDLQYLLSPSSVQIVLNLPVINAMFLLKIKISQLSGHTDKHPNTNETLALLFLKTVVLQKL